MKVSHRTQGIRGHAYECCCRHTRKMKKNSEVKIDRKLNKDDLIVITGAGGFIGGSLARYFHELGYKRIRARGSKSRCPTGTSAFPASSA